jgi:hypothetical protein
MPKAEPPHGDERAVLLGWLDFHRQALAGKCAGLTGEQLVTASVPPSKLTLLGLVRHMTEMERVYGAWGVAGTGELEFVYGPYDDDGPEGDLDDLTPAIVAASMAAWHTEREADDRALAGVTDLAQPGTNGRNVRWNVVKLLQEYARHNGHADLIREAIDGHTGE